MDLYADPITVNCRKVLAGLKLMGVDYDLKKVDYFQAEQKSEAYMAINPNASLPALKDGDLTLWESNAILAYVADKNGKSQFYPTDSVKRADVNRWLFWECAHWFPSTYVFLVENCVKPLLGGATDPATLEKEAPNFHKLAGILETRLAKSAFLCGEGPTIADIAVASPMHLHGWQKLPLESYPHLRHWIDRVEALPCWRDTMVYEGFTTEKMAA
jgi:glutathione S-transferase